MSHVVGGDLAKLQSVPREVARWQKAQQQLMSGRYSHALIGYNSLVTSYPQVAQLWFEFGMAAGGALDFPLAHKAFQASVDLAGDDASLLLLIGQQYQRLRQLDRARECYERAVLVDPKSTHARLSLAAWFERERRVDEAAEAVEKCLANNSKDASAIYFKAFLLHRQGRNETAVQILQDLIKGGVSDPNVKQAGYHLLAVVLDELGQYAEAMRRLIEAKALQRQQQEVAPLERVYDRTSQQRRLLMLSLNHSMIRRWQAENAKEKSQHKLVFLGGHPRSGTTLVEQVLGAHPQILAFDEPEAFTLEVLNDVAPPQSVLGLSADSLNGLSAARREQLRERYFKSLLREFDGEVGDRILVDKNPSPTASLPLWLRVFPGLKVIIPLRDPRDIIISCFFQNLTMTASNVNFLSLERTVRHFTELTDVWLRIKELGSFDWVETRYEDFVENLGGEGRRVTEFIGLPWHAGQARYHETAKRKFVFAPTYHDVTKPVHKRAIRRWENYQEALAPVMEKLALYCKALGYS